MGCCFNYFSAFGLQRIRIYCVLNSYVRLYKYLIFYCKLIFQIYFGKTLRIGFLYIIVSINLSYLFDYSLYPSKDGGVI